MRRHTKPRLGSGKRFRTLQLELSHRKGVRNPRALAAYIGRRKWGPKRMGRLSAAGRKRRR